MRIMAVRFLYPCYFDKSLTRNQGRRVSAELAWDNPNIAQISRAAKALSINVIEEDKTSHFPGQCFAAGGRIRVEYDGSKEILLKQIAEKMK